MPETRTEIMVSVHRNPVVHRLNYDQATLYAESGGKSPKDVLQRNEVYRLLHGRDKP